MKKTRPLVQKVSISLVALLGCAFVAVSFFNIPVSSVEVRQTIPVPPSSLSSAVPS